MHRRDREIIECYQLGAMVTSRSAKSTGDKPWFPQAKANRTITITITTTITKTTHCQPLHHRRVHAEDVAAHVVLALLRLIIIFLELFFSMALGRAILNAHPIIRLRSPSETPNHKLHQTISCLFISQNSHIILYTNAQSGTEHSSKPKPT